MAMYKYRGSDTQAYGCRLVDDVSYESVESELSVASSPIVDIPRGKLLVGPIDNRLMLVHSLLMSSDFDVLRVPQSDQVLNDDDVEDLALGLMENYEYESIVVPMGSRVSPGAPYPPEQLAVLQDIGARKNKLWSGVAGLLLSNSEEFQERAEQGRVFLSRVIKPGLGIRDQVSSAPLIWESLISNEFPNVMGWKIPSATVSRMIQVCKAMPEIAGLIAEQTHSEAARPRQRA